MSDLFLKGGRPPGRGDGTAVEFPIEFGKAGLNGGDLSFDPVLSLQHVESLEAKFLVLGSGSSLIGSGVNQAGPFG